LLLLLRVKEAFCPIDVGHIVGPLNYIAGATPNTDFPALYHHFTNGTYRLY